ncbi:hypothetical protein LTR94_035543, partial [Friedmanniomyces endolithicus]
MSVCGPMVNGTTSGGGAKDITGAAAGLADAAIGQGPVYEHFLMLAHAAAAGMGMALIPTFLIRPELASGAL